MKLLIFLLTITGLFIVLLIIFYLILFIIASIFFFLIRCNIKNTGDNKNEKRTFTRIC
jgi:CHASE3 domain sensor protein